MQDLLILIVFLILLMFPKYIFFLFTKVKYIFKRSTVVDLIEQKVNFSEVRFSTKICESDQTSVLIGI